MDYTVVEGDFSEELEDQYYDNYYLQDDFE